MNITKSQFVISNTDVSKCPNTTIPEYAFIGRSNVGKSSLINMLATRKKLAMTSSHPGKTKLINHFLMNESWHLVDLPGYGYAKEGKSSRESFGRMISDYIMNRKQLTCLFVLIDIRHKPQKVDLEFISWVGEESIPMCIIFTKADKINKTAVHDNIETYKESLYEIWDELPQIFVTSSTKRSGKDEILEFIDNINQNLS